MSSSLDLRQGAARLNESGKLLSFCRDCGGLSSEVEATCSRCGGEALEQLPSTGEIYSHTLVRGNSGSFLLVLIRLGNRLVMGQLTDSDEEVKIGLPVEFTPTAELMRKPPSGALIFSRLGRQVLADGPSAKTRFTSWGPGSRRLPELPSRRPE